MKGDGGVVIVFSLIDIGRGHAVEPWHLPVQPGYTIYCYMRASLEPTSSHILWVRLSLITSQDMSNMHCGSAARFDNIITYFNSTSSSFSRDL